jgi:hypothetical protein
MTPQKSGLWVKETLAWYSKHREEAKNRRDELAKNILLGADWPE